VPTTVHSLREAEHAGPTQPSRIIEGDLPMSQLIDVAPISQRFTEKNKITSMLPISGAHASHVWQLTYFTRVISVIVMVIDVFAEAQEQARAARKRYPFIEW
jgi:hypothetical protein